MAGKRAAADVLADWERKMRKTDVEPTIVAQVPGGGYIGEGYSPQNPEMDALLAAEAQRKAAMRNPTMDSIRGAGDMMGQGLQDVYGKVQQGAQGLGQDMMGGAQALGESAQGLGQSMMGGAQALGQDLKGLLSGGAYQGAPAQPQAAPAAPAGIDPAQIQQLLQSLSPEERAALMQQFGGGQ